MAFNWKKFLVTLAALAPTIIAGTAQLAGESSTESKMKLATDSANLATGLGEALTAGNDQDQAVIAAASEITKSVLTATSLAHAAQGLPTLHPTPDTANLNPQAQPQLVSSAGSTAVGSTAKQVG